ncbi:MAG: antitoxin Xre/MbcA/ParS toxin-binding domain-containing protein [Rhodanobacter sp.]|jgi:putative toxin-antitoxin system antitoxin component (TIGR02293 family)|uniref:antitoxin Xre/MbcA/ParS toxin-binding domain-containing protein n=1 Tax=Rhodanobacter sp. KK11 TaxID=3083255 RepID=UPI002965E74A|nr:antitoxin Xre/MbcA/ParS toxin-binding domain-containing protein [Rhodanobacter sp. KK11]MDW2982817.1 antitoxin Xre/MbcA/ParS toxin-binding domain-containing protein [Rhodanobacter sp. KK11]
MGDPKKVIGPLEGGLSAKKAGKKIKRVSTSVLKARQVGKNPVHGSELQEMRLQARKMKGRAKGKSSGTKKMVVKTATRRILKPLRHVEALEAVRSGLLPQELNTLIERGYARAELVRLIGPRSTIERKLSGSIRLDLQESDRLARLSRIIAKAEAVFGNAEKARHWMERPSSKLPRGESPLSLLDTDGGTQVVTERLLQIEHGIFA